MTTIVGLDIGHYSIKALRLESAPRGFKATRFDEQLLDTVLAAPNLRLVANPDEADPEAEQPALTPEELQDALHSAEDEALLAALAALAQQGALDAEHIAVAMPPDLILSSRLTFPFTDPRQIGLVMPLQFEERIPVEIETLLLDHHLIGPSRVNTDEFDVTAVGVKTDDLRIYIDLWRAGGVDPHTILMGDAALLHLGATLLPELQEPYAIIDLGHRFTRIACLEPDPATKALRLGHARSVQFGGHNITRDLQRVLDTSYHDAETFKHTQASVPLEPLAYASAREARAADALRSAAKRLARELRASLQAHLAERRVEVQHLFLCGGAARLHNLLPFLQQELGLPVDPLPIAGEALAALPDLASGQVNAAQALALALHEVLPRDRRHTVNLRRGLFAHRGKKSWLRAQLFSLAAIGALLFLALTAWFITSWIALDRQVEASEKALTEATTRLFDKPTTDLNKIKRELANAGDSSSVIPKTSAYDMLFELNNRLPEGTAVELYDVRIDLTRQLIKVDGETDSAATVDRIAESYEAFSCFKGQVKKGDVNTVGDQVKFTLNISPQCTPDKKDTKKTTKTTDKEE